MAFNSADTAAFKNVWVFCEQRQGVMMPTTFELISEGRKLANELGVELCGILLGDNVDGIAAELGEYGADKVYVYNSPLLKDFTTDAYTKVIVEAVEELKPEVLLFGASNIGRDLAPPLRGSPAHRSVRGLHPPGHRHAQLQGIPEGSFHPARGAHREAGHRDDQP